MLIYYVLPLAFVLVTVFCVSSVFGGGPDVAMPPEKLIARRADRAVFILFAALGAMASWAILTSMADTPFCNGVKNVSLVVLIASGIVISRLAVNSTAASKD